VRQAPSSQRAAAPGGGHAVTVHASQAKQQQQQQQLQHSVSQEVRAREAAASLIQDSLDHLLDREGPNNK
jgi:hypothetical protein